MDTAPQPPSPMEFGSMPLDPFYAWGISYEPLEVLIEEIAACIEALGEEAYRENKVFTEDELIERFQTLFNRLVETGRVQPAPAPPAEQRRWKILTPKQWARAQNARINYIAAWWKAQNLNA